MAWTTPKRWKVGEQPTAANLNTYIRDNTSYLYTVIANTLLAEAAASIAFTNIPGTFRHLWLVGQARGDTAAGQVNLHLTFNGDGGNNYEYIYERANKTNISITGAFSQASIIAGFITAASSAAKHAGGFSIQIQNYAATVAYKTLVGQCFEGADVYFHRVGAAWYSTSAITTVTLFLPASANFIAGSMATLYGMLV